LNKEDTIRKIILSSSSPKEDLTTPRLSSMEEIEKRHIIEIMRQCNGKIAGAGGAAELLKMNPSTLNSRIKKLGIRKNRNIY
jgi:transcriptional regulator with GAF, ATPase, and Fis domain